MLVSFAATVAVKIIYKPHIEYRRGLNKLFEMILVSLGLLICLQLSIMEEVFAILVHALACENFSRKFFGQVESFRTTKFLGFNLYARGQFYTKVSLK